MTIDAEGINKKIIDSLSMQLDSIFSSTANTQDEELVFPKSPTKPKLDEGFPVSSDDEMLIAGLTEGDDAPVLEEKEKILSTFKQSVQQMQTELVEMMKHKYEAQISEIEKDLKNMDSEKQATLKKTTDTKQV